MVALGVLLLILSGVYNLSKLPIDALPDITSNQVQVITVSPALGALEVERLITFPIEQACANIPGITELRSISRFGLSVVTIVFNDKSDVYWSRQQVSERMIGVRTQIPATAGNPELAPLTTGLGEIYQYFLRSRPGYESKYNLTELRSMQDWIVRRQLMGTPGIADVSSFGGYLKQYEVSVDLQRLNSMQVTLSDVFKALESNNENSGGAYIEKGPTSLFIRTEGLTKTIEEIGLIPVKQSESGIPVLVRDVATVQIGKAIRYGALVYEDKGEVAGAVVLMLKGANANEVVKNVKDKIAVIGKTLPEGVEIVSFYDRTKVVNRALKTVELNLAEGALIVIFILVIFLGNLRAGLIVASVIPLAMLFAVSLMNLFGVSGNLMSLGALDFGLIVDGAVIIVEAVLHQLARWKKHESAAMLTQHEMDNEVKGAASKMMNAAVFGQVIILIVYLPILTLEGIEGKMFAPMAQTVAFALLGAFILSLTYVPAATAIFLSKKPKKGRNISDRMVDLLRRGYKPALETALKKPLIWLGSAIVLFAFSIFVLLQLGGEFIPELEEGDFAIDTRLLTGSSLEHTIEVAGKVAGALRDSFPEIERIVTRVGASEIPTDPMPMEMSDVIILLKPKDEWTSARSYDELAEKMGKVLDDFPGLSAGFQFPIQMRFNELISGARQDVVCKLYGENLDTLSAYAGKLSALMPGVKGVQDLYVETVTGLPQVQVVYNRDALARYGASVQDVNRVIQASFAGASAGLIYENERRYDLVIRMGEDQKTGLDAIQNLLVPTDGGQQIPLYLLADVSIEEGPNQIQRENASRRIIVSFNVRGRDVETVVKEVKERINRQIKLPPGYFVEYGGAFENLQEARGRLMVAVPVSLLLIFFLLYLAFQNIGPGLIIFSAIPLSAMGGIFALWMRGMPFSISAGIGFIALFGVSVLNGIVLITEIRRLYKEDKLPLNQSIIDGCISRLRPVLMTAAVASFGFLPMALSQRAGAEVQRPLATVVIAGLISSTFLTLFILPILYQWMEKRKRKRNISVAICLSIFLMPATAMAQIPKGISLTLSDALAQVKEKHPEMMARMMNTDYREALIATARTIPKTIAELEGGQNQGPFFDFRLSATQFFQPVGLAKSRAKLFTQETAIAKTEMELTQRGLEMQVRTYYNQYYAGVAREQLLVRLDSLLSIGVALSKRRVQAGETDKMELINLELLRGTVGFQLQKTFSEQAILRNQLARFLLMEGPLWLSGSWFAEPLQPFVEDSLLLLRHPLLLLKEQEAAAARNAVEVEKAMKNPEWNVGINTISVTGWQQTKNRQREIFYNAGDRFFAGVVGVNLPIFAKGQKAKITAAGLYEKFLQQQTVVQQQQLQMKYAALLNSWQNLRSQYRYFQEEALPRTRELMQLIEKRLKLGAINYLELSTNLKQAIETELTAMEVRMELESKLIELQYFK